MRYRQKIGKVSMKKINTDKIVSSQRWANRMFGFDKGTHKRLYYKGKNNARILDLLHYFGKDWKDWFHEDMYTGRNNRGIITKTVKGVKYGKSNRRRKALDETRT
jgi:hypothetical protein